MRARPPISASRYTYLSLAQYNTACNVAELIAQTTRGGSVATVWQRILGAPGGGMIEAGMSAAAERAGRMLRRLAEELGPSSGWVFAVCGGVWLPWVVWIARGERLRGHEREDLGVFCDGLDRIARFWSPSRTEPAVKTTN